MLKYNKAMAGALSTLKPLQSINAELSSIIEKGFFHKDGCEFLRYFEATSTHARLEHFPDRTGYECFVNSLHIDDYVESDWLGSALQFADQLLESWCAASHPGVLQTILSSDDDGATLKAHVVRAGESWLNDDLEGYEGQVLLATSEGRELRALLSARQ